MDIVSRIKLFLSQNGIANSQFADTCEIPRPTLSQLLNGRNKKVSDEVLTKIHNAYPALNMMWLMFGDGNMFVPNENSGDFAMAPQPVENNAKSMMPENASDNGNILRSILARMMPLFRVLLNMMSEHRLMPSRWHCRALRAVLARTTR